MWMRKRVRVCSLFSPSSEMLSKIWWTRTWKPVIYLDMDVGHESISPISYNFVFLFFVFAAAKRICTHSAHGQNRGVFIKFQCRFYQNGIINQLKYRREINGKLFMEFPRILYFDRNRINWLFAACAPHVLQVRCVQVYIVRIRSLSSNHLQSNCFHIIKMNFMCN